MRKTGARRRRGGVLYLLRGGNFEGGVEVDDASISPVLDVPLVDLCEDRRGEVYALIVVGQIDKNGDTLKEIGESQFHSSVKCRLL